MTTRTTIAEHYLTIVAKSGETPTARVFVRLAAKYEVPFGRIVNLSGLHPDTVVAYLEGDD